MTSEILSIWRSPLDKTALGQAQLMADSQPRCSIIGYGEDFSPMTIYNLGYYVDTQPSYVDALIEMLQTMTTPTSGAAAGGLAFIPQQSFPLTASDVEYSFPFKVPDNSVIVGSGGGGIAGTSGSTGFFHFVITPSGSGTTFLEATGADNCGGVYLRSLAFQWLGPANAKDICVHADVWNAQLIRCTFVDCPTAVLASGLSTGLQQCTINYTVSSPNNTTAVILSGTECLVLGPGIFSQTSQADGGATGCIGIVVQGVEHAVIADMQLYGWTCGIDFSQESDTAKHILATHITNCEILCWQNALNIQVYESDYGICGLKVTSCTLAKTSDSTDADAIVNVNGQGSTSFHDINLIDCTVFNMAVAPATQDGLAIVNGSDIKIIGGTYSNNGYAGIAITGNATDVQIVGVNLQPSYPGAPNVNNQQYALVLAAGSVPGGILVSGCDMTGYSGSAVYVDPSVTPADFFIVDCPGYNDQNTPLTATPSQLMAGVSASKCTSPYFGASVISYTSIVPVMLTVFGQTISSSMGVIFLPSPYDEISFNVVPTSFLWTGQ